MAIDTLEIQIHDNAEQAVDGLTKLTSTLTMLKTAASNNAGLGRTATYLKGLSEAAKGINGANVGKFTTQLTDLITALAPLQHLGKNNLSSFVNSLKKVPDVTKSLDVTQTNAFADAIQRVATAVRPLAVEMEKISMGFSAMPRRLQSFITQMDKSATSSYKAASGYRSMALSLKSINFKAAITGLIYIGRRVASVLKGMVDNATQYVEDMNLVQISLGEYAGAIGEYAQRAQDLLGVDAAEFMKTTGVFMSIADGLPPKLRTFSPRRSR